MPMIGDRVYDAGLSVLDTEATHLHVCTAEPASFATAVGGLSLGNKVLAAGSIGAPAAGVPDGRQVTVAALTGGDVTATGTAAHWALVDTVNSRLLAAGPLAATQVLTSGNTFATDALSVRMPAAV
jgi:hypothetical protein